jgi:hypothetical protein
VETIASACPGPFSYELNFYRKLLSLIGNQSSQSGPSSLIVALSDLVGYAGGSTLEEVRWRKYAGGSTPEEGSELMGVAARERLKNDDVERLKRVS